MNSTLVHSTERLRQRRVAVLASIRAASNLGRGWDVAALVLGAGIAALWNGVVIPLISLAVHQRTRVGTQGLDQGKNRLCEGAVALLV